MKIRPCQHCGLTDHMTQVLDEEYGIISYRYRVCFKCEYALQSDPGQVRYVADEDDDMEDVKRTQKQAVR